MHWGLPLGLQGGLSQEGHELPEAKEGVSASVSDIWISLSMKQTGNFQTGQAVQRSMCGKQPEKQTARRAGRPLGCREGLG